MYGPEACGELVAMVRHLEPGLRKALGGEGEPWEASVAASCKAIQHAFREGQTQELWNAL